VPAADGELRVVGFAGDVTPAAGFQPALRAEFRAGGPGAGYAPVAAVAGGGPSGAGGMEYVTDYAASPDGALAGAGAGRRARVLCGGYARVSE
jgi:hypothetical protein